MNTKKIKIKNKNLVRTWHRKNQSKRLLLCKIGCQNFAKNWNISLLSLFRNLIHVYKSSFLSQEFYELINSDSLTASKIITLEASQSWGCLPYHDEKHLFLHPKNACIFIWLFFFFLIFWIKNIVEGKKIVLYTQNFRANHICLTWV